MIDTTPAPSWTSPVVMRGLELAALERFHFDSTWTGYIEPDMMGPGSPFMSAMGRATFEWTDDRLWLRGTFEQDQYADGELVLTWHAHYLAGWDPQAAKYVAIMVDNCGHAGMMRGEIAGDRLVLASDEAAPVRFRIVWDLSDPERPTWSDEVAIEGGPWQLIERYTLVPKAVA